MAFSHGAVNRVVFSATSLGQKYATQLCVHPRDVLSMLSFSTWFDCLLIKQNMKLNLIQICGFGIMEANGDYVIGLLDWCCVTTWARKCLEWCSWMVQIFGYWWEGMGGAWIYISVTWCHAPHWSCNSLSFCSSHIPCFLVAELWHLSIVVVGLLRAAPLVLSTWPCKNISHIQD
jgi:hypothetical protein